jgi:hypothetical protein
MRAPGAAIAVSLKLSIIVIRVKARNLSRSFLIVASALTISLVEAI